jgi:hypothetical protein
MKHLSSSSAVKSGWNAGESSVSGRYSDRPRDRQSVRAVASPDGSRRGAITQTLAHAALSEPPHKRGWETHPPTSRAAVVRGVMNKTAGFGSEVPVVTFFETATARGRTDGSPSVRPANPQNVYPLATAETEGGHAGTRMRERQYPRIPQKPARAILAPTGDGLLDLGFATDQDGSESRAWRFISDSAGYPVAMKRVLSGSPGGPLGRALSPELRAPGYSRTRARRTAGRTPPPPALIIWQLSFHCVSVGIGDGGGEEGDGQ